MTTVINTPGQGNDSDSSASMVVIVVILLIAAGLFFVYVMPTLRTNDPAPKSDTLDINVKLPSGNSAPANQ